MTCFSGGSDDFFSTKCDSDCPENSLGDVGDIYWVLSINMWRNWVEYNKISLILPYLEVSGNLHITLWSYNLSELSDSVLNA